MAGPQMARGDTHGSLLAITHAAPLFVGQLIDKYDHLIIYRAAARMCKVHARGDSRIFSRNPVTTRMT
jgi:hypothetical protein